MALTTSRRTSWRSTAPHGVIWGVLATSFFVHSAVANEDRIASLQRYLIAEARAFRLPGVAASVIYADGDPVLLVEGDKVTSSSAFVIGSCSKTVTALATLIALRDAGLPLDTRLSDVLPELRFRGQAGGITIRNLLEHRSGLSRRQGFASLPSLDELRRADLTLDPVGEPSDAYRYSNLNYAILGLAIERITGKPYAEYVDQSVFQPLGMQDSYAEPPEPGALLAPEYQYFFGFPVRVRPFTGSRQAIPAGFVRSSIEDQATFWRCLLNGGRHGSQQVFPREEVARMSTPGGGAEFGYAMGLSRSFFPPAGIVLGHEGATPTGYACAAWFPDQGYGLMLMTNVNLFDPLTDPGSDIFRNAVRILEGESPERVRPYKIWLRYVLVMATLLVVWRFGRQVKSCVSDPSRLQRPRDGRQWAALIVDIALPLAIWRLLLWQTEISLSQFVVLEPDLAWTFLLLTGLGIVGAVLKRLSADRAQTEMRLS